MSRIPTTMKPQTIPSKEGFQETLWTNFAGDSSRHHINSFVRCSSMCTCQLYQKPFTLPTFTSKRSIEASLAFLSKMLSRVLRVGVVVGRWGEGVSASGTTTKPHPLLPPSSRKEGSPGHHLDFVLSRGFPFSATTKVIEKNHGWKSFRVPF